MSLTNRLSLYFLVALAIVLMGFSASLYILARIHLYGQLSERLQASMKTLVAGVEVHSKDVQWEPLERRITLGEDSSLEQPRWTLHDLSGTLKDFSSNLSEDAKANQQAAGWYQLSRRMRAGVFAPEIVDSKKESLWVSSLQDSLQREVASSSLPNDRTFVADGLTLTVAVSEVPVRSMLNSLILVLVMVSVSIWLIAAFWGQWLCRRALAPILQMASSARTIRSHFDSTEYVNVPPTRDELADLGAAFNDLLSDVRQALERQRRFAGDASHQLRTPLAALLASVEVALRQDRSPHEYQRVLQTVVRRGGQLRQIIESLLFLARGEAANQLGTPEVIDLNPWIEEYLEGWKEHARIRDISIDGLPNPAMVSTYPGLLGQVLDNLIDNACKYSSEGTPIRIAVDATPTHVSVSVTDKGVGIPESQQLMIFEPFFRGSESRWQGKPGVGLGLAVVHQLVVLLGGKIEVESKPWEGSQFILRLPAAIQFKNREPREAKEKASTT